MSLAPTDDEQDGGEPRFRLLFVCTGNICRSPMAERLLAAWLAEAGAALGVSISSAGTHALVGEPISAPAAALVERHGGRPEGHRARQVTDADLSAADLVLALTRDHRSAVARQHPAVVRKVFTLREMGRLAAVCPPVVGASAAGRWRSLTAAAVAARGSLPPHAAASDDVIDPYRQSQAVYEQCAEQILPALTALVTAVVVPPSGG